MLLEYVSSVTAVIPRSIAAARSTWSEPIPAVIARPQLRRLGDALGRQVGGPERLGDDDLGVPELSLEDRVRTVFVRSHDEGVAAVLEERSQAELPGNAAQKLARFEVDPLGGWRRLSIVVALDPWNRVSSIRGRIPVNGIVE